MQNPFLSCSFKGNDHLAGPDAHGVGISVSMVAKADGELVLTALERNERVSGSVHFLTAAMVPIHCLVKSSVVIDVGSDLCAPTTAKERAFVRKPTEGGWLTLDHQRFEFLIATFGVIVSTSTSSDVL